MNTMDAMLLYKIITDGQFADTFQLHDVDLASQMHFEVDFVTEGDPAVSTFEGFQVIC